ncbi:hypothetical protein BDV40DRAFT_106728 [Aspergillus tamarii]|uniref:Uncharacterized protein n=1 Tax=Aspergillus tamarii TaxID=41984 RepID=A0A5N6V1S8_ASPTM|nr:hypothetical protein BDV40DRAFT_106728 [Aspergillus tamarii]
MSLTAIFHVVSCRCSISNCYDYVLQFPGSVSSPKLCWSDLFLLIFFNPLFFLFFFILARCSIFFSIPTNHSGKILDLEYSQECGGAFNQSGTWGLYPHVTGMLETRG